MSDQQQEISNLKQELTRIEEIEKMWMEADKKFFLYICGGLIAVDFLFVQGYLSLSQLDIPERIALYCFAICIPILATYAISFNIADRSSYMDSTFNMILTTVVFSLTTIIDIIGITSCFWHFSPEIGILFLFCTMVGMLIYAKIFDPVHKYH